MIWRLLRYTCSGVISDDRILCGLTLSSIAPWRGVVGGCRVTHPFGPAGTGQARIIPSPVDSEKGGPGWSQSDVSLGVASGVLARGLV